jgi:L-rhamnose mutarotase
MRIALHTTVREDRIEEYEDAHRHVPAQLVEAIRAAGATEWTIWRSGTDLFHVIECEDYAALTARLSTLDVVHDYSPGGGDAALPVVWEL